MWVRSKTTSRLTAQIDYLIPGYYDIASQADELKAASSFTVAGNELFMILVIVVTPIPIWFFAPNISQDLQPGS